MSFVKGYSGNPNGRPIGAVNLATKEIREAVTTLINNNLPKLQTDLDGMTPENRTKCLIALMEFVLPKVQRVQVESADEKTVTIQEIRSYDIGMNLGRPSWFDDGDRIKGMEIK